MVTDRIGAGIRASQTGDDPMDPSPSASGEPPEQTVNVAALRLALRGKYITRPDDSHGEPYINRGIVTALRSLAGLVGDIDYVAKCEPDADRRQTSDVWCSTHQAPLGSSKWCDLAEQPWEWNR
jgi:hypothetical protein